MTKLLEFLKEYLRINAVRRVLALVDVKRVEIAVLIVLATLFAVFEGVGLSLLLPILQYAEGGKTAIIESSGAIWSLLDAMMKALHLPVTLPVLLALGFIPILLRQVVFYANVWYSATVAGRVGVRMRSYAVENIFHADPEFFNRYPAGELYGVTITQTWIAGNAILALLKLLSIAMLMALYVAILVALSVPLALTSLAFAALVSVIVRQNIVKVRAFGLETARVSQRLAAQIAERFDIMRLIKLRDRTDVEAKQIQHLAEELRVIDIKQAKLGANIEVTADPLLMLSIFVTLYIGISVLGMTLAQLGLMLFVLNRFSAKIKEFNATRQLFSTNYAGLVLVNEVTDDAKLSNTILDGDRVFDGLRSSVELHSVNFSYPDSSPEGGTSSRAVLKDVTVSIPAGSFTAIVGRSGSGKSTLVELLPRFRDVTDGSIRYDGTDVRQFVVGSLRKGIGYLTQNPMLFNDSVRANLLYGVTDDPGPDKIREALEAANATFLYDLPDGLDTNMGDRGVRFSGGEKQRIALARVLLEDCSLLILDEPTSALDSESESYIQDALARLHGKKTIVVIAHRLATVMQADQLLVMEDGRITERGTHQELLEMESGHYRKLFESQLLL